MKKVFAGLMALLVGGAVQAQLPGAAKYVVMVTVDGFRPEFYLDSAWGMPTVRELMRRGVATDGMNPVFPSVTYPDHTTMITGVTPARHGIVYNTVFQHNGNTENWYWDYNLIKTETLFDAVQKAGGTTACVRWPVTYKAPIDFRVPEFWDPAARANAHVTTGEASTPGLWKELQDSATGFLSARAIGYENDELIGDENMGRIAGYILQHYKPNFLAVHLAGTDHFEHEHGREAYLVKAAVAGADRAIKSMVENLQRAGIYDSTLFVVLGDHGFEDIYRNVHPNFLLKQAGLITDMKTGNWKAAFHSQGGSAFLRLKDPKEVKTLEQVRKLLAALPDSVKSFVRVLSKKELTAVGADPAIELALTGLKGTSFGGGEKELVTVFPRVRGTHGFYPDHQQIRTGFVAAGPGLKAGIRVPEMNMVDVAPIVVATTGVTLPGMEGRVPAGILE